MAISTDKIQLVPSNEETFKNFPTSNLGKTTVIDLSGNISDQVYTAQQIPFMTIIPVGEILNDEFWPDGNQPEVAIHELKIIVDKNVIPSVSGMKIIGYVSNTSKAGYNTISVPISPAPGTVSNEVYPMSNTVMFKLWREFAWEFQNDEPPYKPFLRKNQGGDIETFANTSLPNSKFGNDFEIQGESNESAQTMYRVVGLDSTISCPINPLDLGGTSSTGPDNWDIDAIDDGQGKSIQTYSLKVKVKHLVFNPNLDLYQWSKIKGLITLY